MNVLIVFVHPEPRSMRNLETETSIAFRKQNFGDYRIPEMELQEGLERPGEVSFAMHIRKGGDRIR